MKENVWEFQHPNFQAGGKADLDSIKRKATVSKKDAEAMDPPSPGRVHPLNSHNSSLSNDDAMRFIHMEERLRLMEMDMISMGDELKEARNREVGMMGLMREMIGQIGQLERGLEQCFDEAATRLDRGTDQAEATANTPRSTDDSPSQRIVYLYQMLDQITGSMHPGHGYGYGPSAMHPAYPSHPSHVHVGAPPRQGRQQHMPPPLQHQHSYTMQPPSALVSARTSDGSGSNNNPSPASNQSQSARMAPSQSQQQQQQQQQQAVLPSGSAGSSSNVALGQTQYGTGLEPTASNAGPAGTAATATEASQHPTFADTGAWLTENTNMPMPVYHRKSSDGQALRFMMDILTQQGGASQNQGGAGGTGADGRFTDTQDPLDTTARQSDMPQAPGLQVNYPIVQQSPFGTLLIPAESGIHPNALANAAANMSNGIGGYGNDSSAGVLGGNSNGNMSGQPSATLHELPSNGIHTAGPGLANGSASSSVPLPSSGEAEPVTFGQRSTTDAQGNTNRLRRSTLIKPSWNKTPRILVVEDDVVYRQLSSKFLEKFGCVVETVVNASEAIEKMNSTKYDLVLMDIFFGPSMDG
jgi:osomolarity two-component system response regulator SKN7